MQGIPLPVLMFLVYFGISIGGFDLPALVAAGTAMTLYSSAYLGEIWKACIQAVPKTQWEAAECLAMSPIQRAVYVILPQAARIAIAPTVGFSVQVVKGTALASIIGFVELTKAGTMLNNATFRPFLVYSLVAAIYFALCFPLSWFAHRLEGRYHVAR